jgi:tetratricopeptide (TPR) repeat protein
MFKHPLTQEVVYNGLLKKDRQAIHEQIAMVMEQLFENRLSEFYETLAFHFKQGQSLRKAIEYLVKSGEKSLKRYAVEESHQYFNEAFDLLRSKQDRTWEEDALFIELLTKWSLVFYYRGDAKGLADLLSAHKELAETIDDRAKLGMFYVWYGFSLWLRNRDEDSYKYLQKGLKIGEEIGDEYLTGYACNWLVWTCAELGLLDEAIRFGERAQEIASRFPLDQFLYFKSMGGMGYTHYYRGDSKKAAEAGKAILEYGQRHSNIRSMVMGHFVTGLSHFMNGDFLSAIEAGKKGVETAVDPFYSQFPRFLLGSSYAQNGQYQEAVETLEAVASYSRDFGCELLGAPTMAILGMVFIAKGQMNQGSSMIEQARRTALECRRRCWYLVIEHTLGQIFLRIVNKSAPTSLSAMAKNIGFIVKNVPSAAAKAEEHFKKAIQVAKEIGAKGILGETYLGLGLLHKAKGRTEQARECIHESIQIFEQCEAEAHLNHAKETLASLK